MLDVEKLHRLAQQGALLLAPNLRSARQIRTAISALPAQNQDALTDRILHWPAWTSALHRAALLEGREDRVLLQPLQERLLWEQILNTDTEIEPSDALLELCLSATALLYQHNATETLYAQRQTGPRSDIARFAGWFREFERRCQHERLLPAAALETALTAQAVRGTATQTLVLCDLAGLSPAQNSLLATLARQGATILEAPRHTVAVTSRTLLRCQHDTDELRTLAEHLAQALQSARRPGIAVVVPDLSTSRDRIERTLREHLQPRFATPFHPERQPLWEFSTGHPLAASGVIADALHLLTWTVRELEPGEISRLLRSPHLEWPMDAETAASLDATLLRRHPHLRGTWSPRSAAHLLQKGSPNLRDTLLQRTRSWSGLHHSAGSFTAFAERARHILRDFGWFRSGERTSTEFQAVTRFGRLLDSVASLDLIGGEPPLWPAFVHRLTAAARSTSFAPENTGAPIQFLTPDESTGVEAGELWVAHADENRWNSRATAHPLLPLFLQRQHGMPGTDPGLDQTQFRQQIERIAQIAPSATFSYALSGDAGEQRPTSVIAALPGMECRDTDPAGRLGSLQAGTDLQTFEDGALIPLVPSNDSVPVAGGVSVLQSQAACAFRAFAERRLGSAALETRDLGMDARDRGSFLHTALQDFWKDTHSSEALFRLIADDHLASAIHRAVDHALQTQRDPADRWSEFYLEVQRTRLEKLLDRWLRMEAGRPPFHVTALEKDVVVPIGPMHLRVRVDRIDEVTLADGSKAQVILDYKTGLPTARKWEGERPDEPQLPLYATTALSSFAHGAPTEPGVQSQTIVGAIAFAVVRAGDKLDFVAAPAKSAWLSRDPKATSATLDADLETWRNTLQTLAEDFAAGTATVGPKEYPATCRFCDQRLLCRLNPAMLDAEEPTEVEA